MNRLTIDFAFEGFRIIRQKPGLIVAWGLVLLIGNAIAFGCALPLAWPTLTTLFSGTDFTSDPMALWGAMGGLILPILILIVITVIARAIVDCAVLRLVLESPDKSFGYMRFGSDEMRMIGFGIVMGLLMGVFSFACSLASSIVGGVLTISLAKTEASFLGTAVQLILYYGSYYFIAIKLSLAKSQTFKQKSLNFFGSWNLTNGHVGTLLLGYIVLGILMFVVSLLCIVIFLVVVLVALSAGGLAVAGMSDHMTAPEILALLKKYGYLVGIYIGFVSLVVSPLLVAMVTGGPAAAYRTLAGVGSRQIDNVF